MKNIRYSLLCILFILFVQNLSAKTITGIVTDADSGEALISATIVIKGTKEGTVTDFDGKYSLEVADESAILVCSYTGYESIEQPVKGKTSIDFQLTTGTMLEEVTVAGYKAKKESFVKRAFKKDKIAVVPSTVATDYSPPTGSIDAMLKGTVPGLKIKGSETILPSSAVSGKKGYSSGTLTAGEVNDFNKWEMWQDISQDELDKYRASWAVFPDNRYAIQLKGSLNQAVIGATIMLKNEANEVIWTAISDNTGKAELWANFTEEEQEKGLYFDIIYKKEKFNIKDISDFHNGINTLKIDVDCDVPDLVEIAMIVDATGSMGDEIDYLKVELEDVINKAAENLEGATINLASVFYRDKTDAYLTKKSDFSTKVTQTTDFIKEQSARGGGDYPEAVESGLAVAIDELNWSDDTRTKIIFLILDAPPHSDDSTKALIFDYTQKAAEKGIRIIPVGCSGIDKSTEYLMRCMALATNGTYTFLTDDSGVGNPHIKPSTDEYKVEKLNELMIRLITQFGSAQDCNEPIVITELDSTVLDTTFVFQDIQDSVSNEDSIQVVTRPVLKWKYYPNPTDGIITVEVSEGLGELFIADLNGKFLKRVELDGQTQIQMDLSQYANGIYQLIYVVDQDKMLSGKVILNTNNRVIQTK